ncbi:hypothetical protein AAMO2058_000035700 [Amorphochlora amoebiformis]
MSVYKYFTIYVPKQKSNLVPITHTVYLFHNFIDVQLLVDVAAYFVTKFDKKRGEYKKNFWAQQVARSIPTNERHIISTKTANAIYPNLTGRSSAFTDRPPRFSLLISSSLAIRYDEFSSAC